MATSNDNNSGNPCTAEGCTCGALLADMIRLLGFRRSTIKCDNPACQNTAIVLSMNSVVPVYPESWKQCACSCSSKTFRFCSYTCQMAVKPKDRRCRHCDKPRIGYAHAD